MEDNRKIGIAIPSYNRYEMTVESFMDVYGDPRIESITIIDDASDLDIFHKLREVCEKLEKVKLLRNINNLDCYFNKATALTWSNQKWNILLDSDNVLNRDYIDTLYEIPQWDDGRFYTPSFAAPHFNFVPYEGVVLTKENIAHYIDRPMLEVCLNAANYFVNKDTWLKAFDANTNPVTSDSIFIAYNHLKNGGSIEIVKGLQYEHRVNSHKEEMSHYQKNNSRTPQGFHQNILQQLRQLV